MNIRKFSSSCYDVLERLFRGVEISNGQLSLFQLYDFSIIPIEFISNIYELFIGQNDQEENGAYYTPLFLVDYILRETVGKKFLNNKEISSCKVLDPACGSGIFLVEALRKIVERYTETHSNVKKTSKEFKTFLHEVAKENLFGIDKDLSAVQVAIFSVYLTLLDYQEPPEIESFKFPGLLNTNFFNADFFDTRSSFNEELKVIEFDFILGNPPWKGHGIGVMGKNYLDKRKIHEHALKKKHEVAINNGEIAEGFILRVSDFAGQHTHIALIIRSSILYNLGYEESFSKFRQYWLEEFFVDKIFELAPVRYEVFDKSTDPAIAPAAVAFYRYAHGQSTDKNILDHLTLKPSKFFSLFKIFTINRPDFKKVEQRRLKKFDWLWKILVYGTYLDFNFIERLKNNFQSIKETISDTSIFISGTGIQYSSNEEEDSSHLCGLPFVDTRGLHSFFIDPRRISTFDKKKVHRSRDEKLFKAPMLLVREGLDMKTLTAKAAISKKDVVFKDSLTSIKIFKNERIVALKNILALLNSKIFSYYAVNTFSSIGIERERAKNYNKFSIPYIDTDLDEYVTNIETAKKQIFNESKKALANSGRIAELNQTVRQNLAKINDSIFRQLNITKTEATLIDYTLNVSLPLILKEENSLIKLHSPLPFGSPVLNEYAKLFLERFKPNMAKSSKKFHVEIWHTPQIVGMFFKVDSDTLLTPQEINWQNKNDDAGLLSFLIQLGTEKITEKLFVHKDIRGFEKEYFYVFKPNEKHLWHKAIGFLDVNEFMDSILIAAKRENEFA